MSFDLIYFISEWSTTESSDDIEKQELDEASDDEEANYLDASECFPEPHISDGSVVVDNMTNNTIDASAHAEIVRRTKLPDPVEKEKGVSLWSMIKDNVGKDLTRVCLPVYFNEPISSLQKCFEDLEYCYLLDRAYEHGNSV